MKKALIISFTIVFSLWIYAQNTNTSFASTFGASFKWMKTSHNFGKITQNKPVIAEFEFENTGNAPLVITNAKGSCGCTVPEYPKAPIPPGGSGKIKAKFDAKKTGTFNKTVTIYANVPNGSAQVHIKGEVVAKKAN